MPVLAIAGAVVSCNDYDNGFDETQLSYSGKFVETFGKIDPQQDWNLAERATVTVSVAKPSTITIFALVNGTYSIVGQYANVTSTEELAFDVLEGTTDLLVSDGATGIYTKVGKTVSFSGAKAKTRTTNAGTSLNDQNGMATNINVSTSNYVNFSKSDAMAYAKVLPELNSKKAYDETNLPRATKNFKYVSNGRFSFHPVYWQTSSVDQIGIYYMDELGYHEVDVYTIKEGDELQNIYAPETGKAPENVEKQANASTFAYDRTPAPIMQRSKEIVIDIPAGTVFGFYLKNTNEGNVFYSDAAKNGYYNRFEDHKNEKACYAASVVIDGSKYLCFEDWYDGDFDLNDVVFKFLGNMPTVIEEDPTAATWILACEDLGGTFDWDFNDVVFKVSHISGETTANITPLAAGGTLASYIFYENPLEPNSVEQCVGEVHQLMGAEPAQSGKYSPINVYGLRGTPGETVTINVDEKWSMAHYSSDAFDLTKQYAEYNMGGFTVRVLKKYAPAMPKTISVNTSEFGNASIVAAPDQGVTPQMVCIPYIYNLDDYSYIWAWSNEFKTLAKPDGTGSYPLFAGWVNDHTSNPDWYKYPNGDTVEEFKWLTEPDPDDVLNAATIGGVPSINWASTEITVTGNQKFLVPSGQNLWMKLQVNGEDYTGPGTFTATIDAADTGSKVQIWNNNELYVEAHGEKPATAKVTVEFSGDHIYKPATVVYTIMIPKKEHLYTNIAGQYFGLKLSDDNNLYMVQNNEWDDSQNWYIIQPINSKGNPVYDGYFWLCNAANKKVITISNDASSKAIEASAAIPIGSQSAYFKIDENGRISVYKYTGVWNFGIVDANTGRVGMQDNRISGNAATIISFSEKAK